MGPNGINAQISSNNVFLAQVPVVAGANSISIVATDGDGNVNKKSWNVSVPAGGTNNISYSGDGNILSYGTHTFVYDSLDRVTNVTWSNGSSLGISYDPFGRRIEEVIKDAKGNVVADREWTFAPAGSDHFRAKEAKHRAIVIALAFYLGPRHFSRFAFAILP